MLQCPDVPRTPASGARRSAAKRRSAWKASHVISIRVRWPVQANIPLLLPGGPRGRSAACRADRCLLSCPRAPSRSTTLPDGPTACANTDRPHCLTSSRPKNEASCSDCSRKWPTPCAHAESRCPRAIRGDSRTRPGSVSLALASAPHCDRAGGRQSSTSPRSSSSCFSHAHHSAPVAVGRRRVPDGLGQGFLITARGWLSHSYVAIAIKAGRRAGRTSTPLRWRNLLFGNAAVRWWFHRTTCSPSDTVGHQRTVSPPPDSVPPFHRLCGTFSHLRCQPKGRLKLQGL
jgi:hypothetical protein